MRKKLPWEKDEKPNNPSRQKQARLYRLPMYSPKKRREQGTKLNRPPCERQDEEKVVRGNVLFDAFVRRPENEVETLQNNVDFPHAVEHQDGVENNPNVLLGSGFPEEEVDIKTPPEERKETISRTFTGFINKSSRAWRGRQDRLNQNQASSFICIPPENVAGTDFDEEGFEVDKEIRFPLSETPRTISHWISKANRRRPSNEDQVFSNHGYRKKRSFQGSIILRPSMRSNANDIGIPLRLPQPVTDKENERNQQIKVLDRTRRSLALKLPNRNLQKNSERSQSECKLLKQIETLEKALEQSEQKLADLQNVLKQNKAEMDGEVQRMNNIFESLDQAQEQRYNNILDIFNDNYNALGLLESQADYVMSLANKAKQASLHASLKRLTWFILEHSMSGLLWTVRVIATIHSKFKKS